MESPQAVPPQGQNQPLSPAAQEAANTALYSPRKMSVAETAVLTIKVLVGFALLGFGLWGITIWKAAE